MTNFIESFISEMGGCAVWAVNEFNQFVCNIQGEIILLGLCILLLFIIFHIKEYSYRNELSKVLKISLLMVISAYCIKSLDKDPIKILFNTIFYNLIPITIFGLIIGYVLDKIFFYKRVKNFKLEIRYINYSISIVYIFLLISSMYGVKYIILALIGQMNLASIKFYLENKTNDTKDEVCNLYETRKKQLDTLKDIIRDSNYENYAIAITGEWGSGKSELITSLIKDNNKEINNYYIYIKPMVSDTQESLIREFKKSISKLMKLNGIYSGRSSSLDKYFKEILQLLQFNNKVSLSNFIKWRNNNSSYKELKEELQDDIDSLLNKVEEVYNKRLIVVIDDFDRVDEEKQIGILSFIKEVIDFKGCITLIAMDYENLKNNEVVKPGYLEKFVAIQLPLVDIKFEEIITFHAENILNKDCIDNDFSKKILIEIKDNIYNYYNNIEIRIANYYENENERIEKSKNNKDKKLKNKTGLKELMDFCTERKKHIDNSRRVIHFLKEINNTIIVIDKLYKDRNDGEKLLDTVRASEVVYFLNYIKVFYKDAYEYLVKVKGIEEYILDLNRKNRQIEKKYFEVILGDIVPKLDYYFKDENKELSRSNTLNLIKDIFINYHFTKNNIELLTSSQKLVTEIDNNNICITDDFLKNIQAYQRAIFECSESKEKQFQRIERLVNYIIVLYNEQKIEFLNLVYIADYKNNNRDMTYVKYYLKEICRLIDEKRVKKFDDTNKRAIQSFLSQLEMHNILQYKYILNELLIIALLNDANDDDINNLFNDVIETEHLLKKIKKYSIDMGLIKEDKNIESIKDMVNLLLERTRDKEYKIIDLELLTKKLEEFLLNCEYINKIKQSKVDTDTIDRYKELSQYFSVKNTNEAKEILNDLAKEPVMDTNMIICFQKLIKFIINEKNVGQINHSCKSNIRKIHRKIKQENCYNNHQWLNITVNVERILSFNKKNSIK